MTTPLPGFAHLIAVIARLRDPASGCPWDLKQTHQSLRPYVLEEAYEVVNAIDSGDIAHLKEELGDLLLQVVLHAQLAAERQDFTADDVAEAIAEKLIRRHPHVFADAVAENAEAVTANWEAIKQAEKQAAGKSQPASVMEDLPKGVPALTQALAVSKRAVKQGFEWPDFESLWQCVMSEYAEFRQARDEEAGFAELEDELGDILFATVNLARFHSIDPEVALNRATQKFIRRYRAMEQLSDKPLPEQPFEVLDDLWNQAKRRTAGDLSRS